MNKSTYLDYNATVPLLSEVKTSLLECMNLGPVNASSVHYYGRKGKSIIQDARSNVANLINAKSENIIFTSSATEAINLLFGSFENIIVSSIEHLAVLNASKTDLFIPVDSEGLVDLNFLEKLLKQVSSKNKKTLVSVMWVNNETGVIQPIKDVVELTRKYECLIHCDAAQALGKVKIDFEDLGADFLTISGHKIGAPTGIGALVYDNSFNLLPQMLGGGQESGMRAGTENILGIRGFGEAASIMSKMADENVSKVKIFKDYLSNKIRKLRPETVLFAQEAKTVGNTLLMALPNIPGDLALMKLDLENFSVSSGSACSSGKISNSHVVAAMGYKSLASNSIRISLPPNDLILETEGLITIEELDRLAECWSNI